MGNFNRGGRSGGGGFKRDFGGGSRRFGDKPAMFNAVCGECGNDCQVPFKPTGERPVLCSFCFDNAGGGRPERRERFDRSDRSDRFDRPDRQMHDATCTKCGADCQVPFRPTGDKEIFCDACFSSVKRDRPAPSRGGGKDSSEVMWQVKMLNEKMDKLIALLSPAGAEEKAKAPKIEKEVKKEVKLEEAKVESPKKEEKVKKEKVVKAKAASKKATKAKK